MSTHKTTTWLNLRNEPRVSPETLIGTLPPGATVNRIGAAQIAGWCEVYADLLKTSGFVSEKFLEKLPQPIVAPTAASIANLPEAHLTPSSRTDSKRGSTNGRAYPLNEQNMPSRNMNSAVEKAASVHNIIRYLDVETSLRYGPTSSATYCNIYAHDFARLAGVYIPRVWWTSSAIAQFAAGNNVPVRYAETVNELSANRLYDWFVEFGTQFGWTRLFNMNDLQDEANAGKICAIIGQRIDLNRSGHITIAVPEGTFKAERNSNGAVIRPLQTQAGAYNYRYFTGNWWSNSQKFRAFGFWMHE